MMVPTQVAQRPSICMGRRAENTRCRHVEGRGRPPAAEAQRALPPSARPSRDATVLAVANLRACGGELRHLEEVHHRPTRYRRLPKFRALSPQSAKTQRRFLARSSGGAHRASYFETPAIRLGVLTFCLRKAPSKLRSVLSQSARALRSQWLAADTPVLQRRNPRAPFEADARVLQSSDRTANSRSSVHFIFRF